MRSSGARLEQIQLWSAFSDCESGRIGGEPLRIAVEIDELDYAAIDAEQSEVLVGLALTVVRVQDEQPVAEVCGTFKLFYRMESLGEHKLQRDFAVRTGLKDAWPAWRGWVLMTLSYMGLGPPPLSPRTPGVLLKAGPEEFDLTREVKRRAAQEE